MKKAERIYKFLEKNLVEFEHDSGGWEKCDPPDFQLYAYDYLEFARKELDKKDVASLINCIGHLKRALECQLDLFLHMFNLLELTRKNNLGLDQKLDFIKKIGIYDSRSLRRMNKIRNKMEHRYEVPSIQEIDTYYDLVSAVVYLLEGCAREYTQLSYAIGDFDLKNPRGFDISYNLSKPSIKVRWEDEESKEELTVSLSDDIEEFIYFLKVLFLLGRREFFLSDSFVLSQLKV